MTAALGKWNDHSQPSIHWPPETKEGPPVPHQIFIHSYLCHPQKAHELGERLELKILSWLLIFFLLFTNLIHILPVVCYKLWCTDSSSTLLSSVRWTLWTSWHSEICLTSDYVVASKLELSSLLLFLILPFSLIWVWHLNIFTMNFHHESICSLGLPASFLVSAGMYIATDACCWIYLSGFADCLQHSISLLQAVSSHKIRL